MNNNQTHHTVTSSEAVNMAATLAREARANKKALNSAKKAENRAFWALFITIISVVSIVILAQAGYIPALLIVTFTTIRWISKKRKLEKISDSYEERQYSLHEEIFELTGVDLPF